MEKQQLCFTAHFRNTSQERIKDLSYQFTGKKEAQGNVSHTNQSGDFEAEPGKKIELSTLSFNDQQDTIDHIECVLKIYHKKSLLVSDTLKISH